MSIQLCSFNVRGIGSKTKREKVFQWLKEQPYSICLLQESHSSVEFRETWCKEWGSNAYFSGNSSNSAGVAILLKSNTAFNVLNHIEIVIGRLQALFIEINDKPFIIINIYGPNNDDASVFNELNKFIVDNEDGNFIIGGDFNTVLN